MSRQDQPIGMMTVLLAAALVLTPDARPQTPGEAPAQPTVGSPSQSSVIDAGAAAQSPSAAPAPPTIHVTPEMLGDSNLARQRYQAAIAAYSKIPDKTAAIWNKMGISYQMMLNFNEAVRCYQKSIKLDGKNSDVLNNLATVYGSLREYGAANHAYRRALKVAPQSAVIHKNYGTNLMTERKYSEGSKEYKRALAIDPTIFDQHDGPTTENAASLQERGAMNYYMALGCARAGYADCAIEYLRNALNEGYVDPKKVAADNDFASLRGNPAFQKLLAEQRSQ